MLQNNYIEPDSTLCVVQKPTLLCSAKTDTTTPGKLGRAVGFSTRASRAGVGFYTTLQVYCNWFVTDFTLLAVSIYLSTFLVRGAQQQLPDPVRAGRREVYYEAAGRHLVMSADLKTDREIISKNNLECKKLSIKLFT